MSIVRPTDKVVPGGDFSWYEFSGWDHANAQQVERLERLTRDVLQPLRDAVGVVDVSQGGWIWSRDGYARDGVHATGAAVDLVPRNVPMLRAYEVIRDLPGTPYGQVLFEGDHVHVHLPGYTSVEGYPGQGEALLKSEYGRGWILDPLGPGGVLEAGVTYDPDAGGWMFVLALVGGAALVARVVDRRE